MKIMVRPPEPKDDWLTSTLTNLASDLHLLGSYVKSLFVGNEIVYLDLKDLLLEQIFADIYYKDYAGKTFTDTQKSDLNARLNEVVKQFKSLSSGGAYIVYPKQLYSKEQKTVTLVIHRGESKEEHPLKQINGYIRKNLDKPIDLDHLEADIEPSDRDTKIFSKASKYQYFRLGTSALKWPWLMMPQHDGELILNILLYRRDNINKLSELKETAWPSFFHPSVAIKVMPERLGLLAILGKICGHPLIGTIIGVLGLYLAFLALK
ncbi:MAG: hypothetical protein PHE55_11785 [Methylococcaceae bacterium]|nr:hypothetical protein [Methylococcaceae bacterium]